MIGPERSVLKATAALVLVNVADHAASTWVRSEGHVAVEDVAALSKYPDLMDRGLIKSLAAKGYVNSWRTSQYRGVEPHQRVQLTATGWLEVLSR